VEKIVDLPDGARIIHHGDDRAGWTVLFFGRLNFAADAAVRARIAELSRESGFAFVIYESPYEAACRRSDPRQRLAQFPAPVRRLLRGLLFVLHPGMWRFLSSMARKRYRSVPVCVESFTRAIKNLEGRRLILAGRSLGARVASLVADDLGVGGLVCFSYPFRNPREDEDPARTAHLAGLRTPCLIFQGDRDGYGGGDVAARYSLSPSIEMEFVSASHDFTITEGEWRAVFGRLHRFIHERLGGVAPNAGNAACR
jgi:hypothetical protein